ncbi:hypothetical protein EDC18_103120 [Natranaerovirga pectinivora]|uniref:Lipoprotein n=1 Tax=Natranaerovirga pectinivora TaxID=682400 RepID=A0A4R3MMD6_9FIRM|nr:hypothetical protein [Natranaerovirga pectinivora]TCT15415.1 hypothetical protein EDC18_103120 [Natranaerovirga pectinivora]
MKKTIIICILITMVGTVTGCGNNEPIALQERDNSQAKEMSLSEGEGYIVGVAIPAGRYEITGDGIGTFTIIDTSFGLAVFDETFDDMEGIESITTDLEEGNEIRITGLSKVNFIPIETYIRSELTTGTWIVGLDIEKGDYVFQPAEGKGDFLLYREGRLIVNERMDANSEDGVKEIIFNPELGDEIHIKGLKRVGFTYNS